MERARLGTWLHEDWKAALTTNPPDDELGEIRRATQLGEPLGSDGFVSQLEGLRDGGFALPHCRLFFAFPIHFFPSHPHRTCGKKPLPHSLPIPSGIMVSKPHAKAPTGRTSKSHHRNCFP